MTKKIKILGQGKYAVSENQQFVDRTGQLVRPIRGPQGKPTLIPVGEAYGFFKRSGRSSDEEIQNDISRAREGIKTPGELEIYLMYNLDSLELNPELQSIANDLNDKGLNFVIRSYLPNQTNQKTAEELSALLKSTFLSSPQHDQGNYLTKVVYREAGRYHSRE